MNETQERKGVMCCHPSCGRCPLTELTDAIFTYPEPSLWWCDGVMHNNTNIYSVYCHNQHRVIDSNISVSSDSTLVFSSLIIIQLQLSIKSEIQWAVSVRSRPGWGCYINVILRSRHSTDLRLQGPQTDFPALNNDFPSSPLPSLHSSPSYLTWSKYVQGSCSHIPATMRCGSHLF